MNDDGIVNIIDLTLIASNFGETGQNDAVVNGDGVVNIIDLTLAAAAFGNTAGAPIALGRDSEIAPTRADGESVASGVYFYSLTAGKFTASRKMLISK